jgi:GR25 family glycosyltransferase involved in LPS biosynthesis
MTSLAAYILNIETRPERVEAARALWRELQAYDALQETAVAPAIYWKEWDKALDFLALHPEISFTQKYLARCRRGQLCATLSHISLWHKLLRSGHDGAVIFEDDIYISDPQLFTRVLEEIPRHPDIDFLRIHQHKKFRDAIALAKDRALFIEDPSVWGFATYYLSRRGAEKLLQKFLYIDDHVDMVTPVMARQGGLNVRTVRPLVVEHQPFTGDVEELRNRHAKERDPDKLQQAASTIWTSPLLFEDQQSHEQLARLASVHAPELQEKGFTVLKGVFSPAEVEEFRQRVRHNLALFRNTRPSSSALHLAGFHRFPELETLHTQLAGNAVIRRFFEAVTGESVMQTIGLSDITINRSQCWHKDLLRGKFSSWLENREIIWGEDGGGVYKVLFYLQPGSSLKVIRGSHRIPIPLDDDHASEPDEQSPVVSIPVEPGDIVIMDIRMTHRGATEDVYASGRYDDDPRILVSTAMGAARKPLTRAMEIGNFHRLLDWMQRNP